MRYRRVFHLIIFVLFLTATCSFAKGLPWQDHRSPFDFKFGNHIDTHQQIQVLPDGTLFGYLYVSFTGEMNEKGIPYAEHTDCGQREAECTVGWELKGLPGSATFVSHEEGNHPLWQVDRGGIPQPGAYTHFHWTGLPRHAHQLEYLGITVSGYFLQLTAKDTFIFRHGGEEILVRNGLDNATHINILGGALE